MKKGILYVVTASILFGVIPTSNKYIILGGMSAECVTFWNLFSICLISLLWAIYKKETIKLPTSETLLAVSIGTLGMGITMVLITCACLYIPAGLSTVLQFIYPTMVSTALVVIFKEKLTIKKVFAIVSSIVGMYLIAGNDTSGSIDKIGIILAICSATAYATYILSNEKTRMNQIPLIPKLFYASLGSTIFLAILTLTKSQIVFPSNAKATLLLFGICGIGYMLAFYFITKGVSVIGAEKTAFINMLEPIMSLIVSTVVFHDAISVSIIIGVILVLYAVFLTSKS